MEPPHGRKGFVQYQCVLPKGEGAAGLAALLERVAAAGQGSFLAVLKLFGPTGEGVMSFPMEGYTLALDFPLRAGTLALLDELDAITHTGTGGASISPRTPGARRNESGRAIPVAARSRPSAPRRPDRLRGSPPRSPGGLRCERHPATPRRTVGRRPRVAALESG